MRCELKIGRKTYTFEVPRNVEIGPDVLLRCLAKAAKVKYSRKIVWVIDERGELVADRDGIVVGKPKFKEDMSGKAALADVAIALSRDVNFTEHATDGINAILTENEIDLTKTIVTA